MFDKLGRRPIRWYYRRTISAVGLMIAGLVMAAMARGKRSLLILTGNQANFLRNKVGAR